MTDAIEIQPLAAPVRATVQLPGSKSITNRALVCAALAEGRSTLTGALDSDDTSVMIDGLRAMGVAVHIEDEGRKLIVDGCDGAPSATKANVFVGNSGTTVRFLTALATLGTGVFRLDGVERMRNRPIGDLVETLRQLGADARCDGENNCPPVTVNAGGLPGGVAKIRGALSSQFLSGLAMVGPAAKEEVTLEVEGVLVSKPYVAMTLAVMRAFGVTAETNADFSEIRIPNKTSYRACNYRIEPDASAASYFWAAAAVTGSEITVEGLDRKSLQGDVAFVDCLRNMGCRVSETSGQITVTGGPLHGIDVDMNAISDTVPTLAVVALFAKGPTVIRNVAHIRHKETDRIGDLATELRKLGAKVTERPDGLTIVPGTFRPATIDTYDDHRMAMSFAVAGLVQPSIVIRDPGCTAKTYPRFFDDLARLS